MPNPLPAEWTSWRTEGARLLAAPPLRRNEQATRGPLDPKFALGDFLLQVPGRYVDALAEELNATPGQFRIYRDVAEKLPPEKRVAASWTVHRDLRDQPGLLRDGLTVRQAGALLGKEPIDSKNRKRLPVSERAAIVRQELADPEVYALIDDEMAKGRAERQLRSRARQVKSEYTKREQELSRELRELQSAKSPFEATVETELQLNKAAQVIEAVDAVLDDLTDPDRVLNALMDLNDAIAGVLLRRRGSDERASAPVIIEGEVWLDRPARAELSDSNQRP